VIILDTDLLTIIQRAESQEYENLVDRLDAANDEVAVCIVSFEEQMRGWLAFIARASTSDDQIKGYARLHGLLEDYANRPILDFDHTAVIEYQRLKNSKVRVGTMDLKIAAIALAHNALLLSRNITDFRRVPGLRVDDWA